jgi:hypothetical protein
MIGPVQRRYLFPSPLWGGEGAGVAELCASVDDCLHPFASRAASRPPSLTLPHKGGGKEQA